MAGGQSITEEPTTTTTSTSTSTKYITVLPVSTATAIVTNPEASGSEAVVYGAASSGAAGHDAVVSSADYCIPVTVTVALTTVTMVS